jgi:hypothetical protein
LLLVLGTVLAGCGGQGATRSPQASALPLVAGSQVVTQVKQCDSGANAYCAVEMVVTAPRLSTSAELVRLERKALYAHGWTWAHADTGDEQAADSPGEKIHLSYSTAYGDLKGIDLGWIHRSGAIELALSRAMFGRVPTMSLMMELGPT